MSALYRVFPVRKPAATQPAASQPAWHSLGEPMLLLVRPTIVEVKEPESKEFPLLSSRISQPATRPTSPAAQPAPRPLDSRP